MSTAIERMAAQQAAGRASAPQDGPAAPMVPHQVQASALAVGIDLQGIQVLQGLAKAMMGSHGILPKHIRSEADALVIMMAGAELGIPPMKALRGIHMVEGKPELSADTMLGLVKRAGYRVRWTESTDRVATLTLVDPRDPEYPHTETFTMEMAAKAGLATKSNWRNYPKAMLKARCISAAVRAFCPEVLASCYVEGEISGDEPVPVMDIKTDLETQTAVNMAAANVQRAESSGDNERIASARAQYDAAEAARAAAMTPTAEQEEERRKEEELVARWEGELKNCLTQRELEAWCHDNGGTFVHLVFCREQAWVYVKRATLAINEIEERTKGKDWITAEYIRELIKNAPPVAADQSEEEEADFDLSAGHF